MFSNVAVIAVVVDVPRVGEDFRQGDVEQNSCEDHASVARGSLCSGERRKNRHRKYPPEQTQQN